MRKLLIACLLAGTAGAAQADIIPTLSASSPVAVGGLFEYIYTATLAADQEVQTGNYFTIYDFQGFDHFGTLGTGFTGSTALLGVTPSRVLPNDSPTVLNVTFTYSGPTINHPSGSSPGVSTPLGSFSVFSKFDGIGLIDFASRAVKNQGFGAGTNIDNVGSTAGPLEGGGSGSDVPEPQTWALLVLGFGLVGVSARRRQSAKRLAA
jgi:hypothetical protein